MGASPELLHDLFVRRKRIFREIIVAARNEVPLPTLQRLGAAVGLSTCAVWNHLNWMEHNGWITRERVESGYIVTLPSGRQTADPRTAA